MGRDVGTIVDFEITQLCEKGELIVGNFRQESIRQACYELRASNIYYENADNKNRKNADEYGYILLKPKQFVVVITMEELSLPANILGRILTKGQLFSIGIVPVNTYADPGFKGKLGIVLCNLSNDYLKITPGEAIAKIEFERLSKDVKNPYFGQHGYDSKMWPKPNHMVLSELEIKADSRIESIPEEIIQSYGNNMASIIRTVFAFYRWLILSALSFFLFGFVMISLTTKTSASSNLLAVFIGVLGSLIAILIHEYATHLRRK